MTNMPRDIGAIEIDGTHFIYKNICLSQVFAEIWLLSDIIYPSSSYLYITVTKIILLFYIYAIGIRRNRLFKP